MNADYVDFMPDVKFSSFVSTYDNCVCDGCHKTGKVIKLTHPKTKYFDGETLTTEYNELWFCMECREKLIKALTEVNDAF